MNDSKTTVAKATKATKVKWISDEEAKEIAEAPKDFNLGSLPGLAPQIAKIDWFLKRLGVAGIDDFAPGFLIQGGKGTGKTMLLDHIANSHWGTVIRIKASHKPEAVKGHFADAINRRTNCVVLIDDIDSLIGNEKSAFGVAMTETLVEAFRTLVDTATKLGEAHVAVFMTCRDTLGVVPSALQNSKYLYGTVDTCVPSIEQRKEILRYYKPQFPDGQQEEFLSKLSQRTHAYTGSDLHSLIIHAKRNTSRQKNDPRVTGPLEWELIEETMAQVPATAMHDLSLKPPKVSWGDIAGNEEVKQNLQDSLWHATTSEKVRCKPPRGILLYGPPGCSKTMAAQAMASESTLNFFSIKGGEVLSKYVGETERTIRTLFQRARAARPAVVFFDEIDAIAGSRETSGASSAANMALSALLSELDGFETMHGEYWQHPILAAFLTDALQMSSRWLRPTAHKQSIPLFCDLVGSTGSCTCRCQMRRHVKQSFRRRPMPTSSSTSTRLSSHASRMASREQKLLTPATEHSSRTRSGVSSRLLAIWRWLAMHSERSAEE